MVKGGLGKSHWVVNTRSWRQSFCTINHSVQSFCATILYNHSAQSMILYNDSAKSFCTMILYNHSAQSFCTIILHNQSFCTIIMSSHSVQGSAVAEEPRRIPIPAEFPGLHRHLQGCPGILPRAGTWDTPWSRERHLQHTRTELLERKQSLGHPEGHRHIRVPSGRNMNGDLPDPLCLYNTQPQLWGGQRHQQSARAAGVPGHLQTAQLTRDFQLISADIKLFRTGVTLASWNWSDRSEKGSIWKVKLKISWPQSKAIPCPSHNCMSMHKIITMCFSKV